MRRARNAAADAAKTPEEARARLHMYEKHVLQAEVEARWHLRMDVPHERVLSAKHIWDQIRIGAVAWAEEHRASIGAEHMAAFLARMREADKASKRLARQSRDRPAYRERRQLEIRQHELDTARATAVAAAMEEVERAQRALAEVQARPREMAGQEAAAPDPDPASEEADSDPDSDEGEDDDPHNLTVARMAR